jgi:ABC-type multidrug transport system ATPase subunit
VIVLKGPSSSGKSTILKLILGDLTASNGSVQISSVTDNTTSITATKTNVTAHPTKPGICPVPILLDSQKPTYEMSRSIGDCVEGIYRLRGVHRDDASLSTLVSELFEMVGLEKYHPSIGSLTPAHLTTSERFRLELVFASLKSMSMGISEVGTDAEGSIPDPRFPAPILCIDEWLDRETSTVIQPIGEALIQLAKRWGSVIIVVTHKPERFAKLLQDNDDNTMIVQLRRGKIIQGGEHIVHSVRWNEEVKKKPK